MGEQRSITNTLEFPYARTLGPVYGAFLTGLRDGRILGIRSTDGRVLCPPLEYDPTTAEDLDPNGMVEVGPAGTVRSWTWVSDPTPQHPLDRPFGFALVQLDGADTSILHAVDAGAPDALSTGARVEPRWADERVGRITDLVFVPEGQGNHASPVESEGPVTMMDHLVSLTYVEPVAPHVERFASALLEGRILGQKSPASGKVFVPPRGVDAMNRLALTEADDVEVAQVGTVTAFTIITPVQYYGQEETEPYANCSVLLDGADTAIGGQRVRVPVSDIRAGMRVRVDWKPPAERDVSEIGNRGWGGMEGCVAGWDPTGDPDVPLEAFKHHIF